MTVGFGALCTDFFVNQKLGLRMDLPTERETLLSLFERMRKERSHMKQLRRFEGELLLETDPDERAYEWMSLRRTSIRSGFDNPDSLDVAYALHRKVLQVAPFFVSISPLDVAFLEVAFGFDFEVQANRNDVVYEALYRDTPLGGLVVGDEETLALCEPSIGVVLHADTHAFAEIKTRMTTAEIRTGRFQNAAISVLARVRSERTIATIDELVPLFDVICQELERFAGDRLVPNVVMPLREHIASMHEPGSDF